MNNLYFSQLKSCKWAMEPNFLETFISHIAALPHSDAVNNIQVQVKPASYSVINGKAVIVVKGVLLKSVPNWVRFWGIDATGYDEIQSQIALALADKTIDGIHLQITSPGGVVDGLADTADMIFNARSSKKVTANIDDLGASAAYFLGSQAQSITANRSAEVGSIGTYAVYEDLSKMAEGMGIKVIVIKSGEHKGMGVPGAEITDAQIDAVQKIVDALADQFVDAVARGRQKESKEIKELATGQLWIADKARTLGLIDSVTSMLQTNSQTSKIKGVIPMDQVETNTQTDTAIAEKIAAEIKAKELSRMKALAEEFPGDMEFAVKSFNEGKTLDQAKAAYCDVLRERIKNQPKPQQTGKAQGAPAIPQDGTDTASSGGDFMDEARNLAGEKNISLTAAMKIVNRRDPKLHNTFLQKCQEHGMEMYEGTI